MQFLVDIIPPKARRYVYGGLSLVGLIYATWQAAGGDIRATIAALVGSAVTALAHANTNSAPPEEE